MKIENLEGIFDKIKDLEDVGNYQHIENRVVERIIRNTDYRPEDIVGVALGFPSRGTAVFLTERGVQEVKDPKLRLRYQMLNALGIYFQDSTTNKLDDVLLDFIEIRSTVHDFIEIRSRVQFVELGGPGDKRVLAGYELIKDSYCQNILRKEEQHNEENE